MKKKLILGTVQFGLNYGVANKTGCIGNEHARSILEFASANNIGMLDTAIAYGDSERTLGGLGVDGWRIISKLPSVPDMCDDVYSWVKNQVKCSIRNLRISQLDGILLHRPDQLLEKQGRQIYSALSKIREDGLAKRIGISIYSPDQLEKLFELMDFDIVQAPLSIFDRRMISSGWATRLRENGVEFHARSIFLQGLLLMPPINRPKYFNRWQSLFSKWDDWLSINNIHPLAACLSYAILNQEVNKVVIGVDGLKHLKEITEALNCKPIEIPSHIQSQDVELLNPAFWNL